jgi:circadian clock protein KaiB
MRVPSKKHRVSQQPKYLLTAYIAGDNPKSTKVIRSLKKLCDEQFPDQYQIKIVDISKHPQVARENNLVALPMVVRTLPAPVRRIIGDLTDESGATIQVEIRDPKRKAHETGCPCKERERSKNTA